MRARHRIRAISTRVCMRMALALLWGCGVIAPMRAQTVVQGVLQLQWGDPPPGSLRPAAAARFEAWLDVGSGRRIALDALQTRRAAGDLSALANRRVAVSYAARAPVSGIDAIVPVELPAHAQAEPSDGRTLAMAPILGSTRWLTVMCKFADVASEPKPRAFFQGQYGNAPGQLGHYWSEVSYGQVDLAGSSAHGWYTLPRPRSAYLSVANGAPKVDLNVLFAECTALADAEVDYAGAQGINLMFNAELDGRAWGGGACAMLEGTYRCTRATWNPPWAFANLAGLAHEMGHGYGLPHSDNSDGDADTHDNPWDLMSDAWRHAATDPLYGLLPKYPGMLQRDRLGWVAPARKRTVPADNRQVLEFHLDAVDLRNTDSVQMIVLEGEAQPDPYRTVLHVIEARRRGGTYEAGLAGDAVIIHVLEDYGVARSVDADTPAADLAANEGSMFRPGEQWGTPDGRHYLHVVSATDTGFVVRIGPRPRVMSTPAPALERLAATASSTMWPSPGPRTRTPAAPVPGSLCTAVALAPWRLAACLRRDR